MFSPFSLKSGVSSFALVAGSTYESWRSFVSLVSRGTWVTGEARNTQFSLLTIGSRSTRLSSRAFETFGSLGSLETDLSLGSQFSAFSLDAYVSLLSVVAKFSFIALFSLHASVPLVAFHASGSGEADGTG